MVELVAVMSWTFLSLDILMKYGAGHGHLPHQVLTTADDVDNDDKNKTVRETKMK